MRFLSLRFGGPTAAALLVLGVAPAFGQSGPPLILPVTPTSPLWQVDPYGQVRFAPGSSASVSTGLFSFLPPVPGDTTTMPLSRFPHTPADLSRDLFHPHIPRFRVLVYQW